MKCCRLAFAVLALLSGAQVHGDTVYTHYNLKGGDALEIMREITKQGPSVHGENAIASIKAELRYDYDLDKSGGMCRAVNFRITPKFHIRLPKLADERNLTAETRAAWQSFYAHAKWHEEEHQRIHMSCISDTVKKAQALPPQANCAALRNVVEALRDTSLAQCRGRHLAFDEAEAQRFPAHAMIRQAMGAAQKQRSEKAERIRNAPQMPDWFYNRH